MSANRGVNKVFVTLLHVPCCSVARVIGVHERFDVRVTVHHRYNNIKSQLDAK